MRKRTASNNATPAPKRGRAAATQVAPPSSESSTPSSAPTAVAAKTTSGSGTVQESAPPAWFASAIEKLSTEVKAVREEARAARSEVANLKRKAPVKPKVQLRQAGLQKQFDLNESVLEDVESALTSLPEDHEASAALENSKSTLLQRQKHLKIADSFSWDTVKVYEEGAVGDSTSDDKRIAEAAATAKRLSSFRNQQFPSQFRPQFRPQFQQFTPRVSGRAYGGFSAVRGSTGFGSFSNGGRVPANVVCYLCNQPGHIARVCPTYSSPRWTGGARPVNPTIQSHMVPSATASILPGTPLSGSTPPTQ